MIPHPPISAVIISKNEEQRLPRCLRSLDFCQEIVILDSGSSDRTADIAREFGARLEVHPFDNHINQKNRALPLAQNDWVLAIDCDEEVSEPLRREILDLKDQWEKYDGFSMPRLSRYLGDWIYHGGWYPDRKLRLFKRSLGKWGGENPHDRVILRGRCHPLSGDLLHYGFAHAREHLQTIIHYAGIASRELWDKKIPFRKRDVTLRPLLTFLRDYLLRRGFLDGKRGFIISCCNAFAVFCKYLRLYERERQAKGEPFNATPDT